MADSQHYPWLHAALARQALVITSSRRLARELRHAYDARQVEDGRSAWASAEVYFWQDWLQRLLEEQLPGNARALLDAPSAAILWEQCLGRTVQAELLSASSLIRQARRAWQRAEDWQLTLDQLASSALSRDERWFARAAADYQQQLDAGRWLDAAQVPRHCIALLEQGQAALPSRVVYAGFDRLSPAQSALFAALEKCGCEVREAPTANQNPQLQPRSYASATMMWRAAGQWARHRLQNEPTARVAIVVPDLETDAAGIARTIREGFAPGWQLASERYRESVEVSYGKPLSAYPAISVAVLCLKLAADGLTSVELSVLLRSEFIGTHDIAERSRFDLQLRSLPDSLWQPARLLSLLEENARQGEVSALHQRLLEFAALNDCRQERRTPADWAKAIDALLRVIGWPGKEQPDSAEFQLQNRWRELLNELAGLAVVRPTLTLGDCVQRLLQIAGEAIYQPESQGSGLRVLGMLEAIGLEFDYLWLGGMDSSRWPAAGNPLALINRQLQRDAGMPDAFPADTLEFARRTLQRICNATPHLEIAWARQQDDQELVPSPLLELDPADLFVDDADPGWFAATLLDASSTAIPQDNAPPVTADEQVSGGAYTVQAMREEPFRAFAQGRLHVSELDPLRPGLTAKERGTIVHRALHHLLREKPAQDDIRAWSPAVREQRIDVAAWYPLGKLWHQADPVLRRLLQLEKERLISLLTAFLDQECAREGFRIEGLEQKATFRYGPVTLKLQIDRLDRLDDGSLLITDYKASEPKAFLDRHKALKQLQLCVYARALEDDSVGGLRLTYLSSREIRYAGEGGSLPGSKIDPADWSAVLEEWCAEVDVLLKRFADGEVGVNALQEVKNARTLAVLSRFAELPDAS